MHKIKILLTLIFLSTSLFALKIGEVPQSISIYGKKGGMALDGSRWDSSSIRDKVFVMFYVDPDEKDTNSHFSDLLKKKKYDRAKYGSIAVVNLAATWKPNFIIEQLLETKQKDFPDTIYIKDKDKIFVKMWYIADDSSNILIFSKDGKVLFYKAGKMTKKDIQKAFDIIENNL